MSEEPIKNGQVYDINGKTVTVVFTHTGKFCLLYINRHVDQKLTAPTLGIPKTEKHLRKRLGELGAVLTDLHLPDPSLYPHYV